MASSQSMKLHLLKWLSLSLSIATVVIAVLLIWQKSSEQDQRLQTQNETSSQHQTANGGEQIEVEHPDIVERKGDKVIWRLTAQHAITDNQQMHLTAPILELYSERGEMIPIQGDEAWYEPEAKNIHFKGHVLVQHEHWRLTSDELRYESLRDIANIPGSFHMQGESVQLRGRTLELNRQSQQIEVKHDVWFEDQRKHK
ncbi:MAG: LPS export ABC transporter periplasmic protein LptC [Zetaproteobacteria bacterium]|nr:LPS export ABC transporter periplasmic protein LptC [Zetaproteobacteria bacterium]